MAYEIISQNNTVTTLADENGNVITVPARAMLALGETFTLIKVNNNTATLEDSTGKVYRDIPCCIDLTQVTGFNVTKVNNNKATLEDGDGNVYAGVPCVVNLTESGGGGSAVIDPLNVTPSTSAQTITATGGVDGYSPVNVSAVDATIDANITANNIKDGVTILGVTGNVVELNGETKTVTPQVYGQTLYPTAPKNAITEITVNAVTSSIDANITAGNIKKDVTILGVTGTYDAGGGSGYNVPMQIDANGSLVKGASFIDLSGVTKIGSYALYSEYYNCVSISGSVDLSHITDVSSHGLDSTFYGSNVTGSIYLNATNGVNANGCSSTFRSCTGITSVQIGGKFFYSAAVQRMFQDCTGITSVTFLPNTEIGGGAGATSVAQFMFSGCTEITTLDVGGITKIYGASSQSAALTRNMFSGCTGITSATFTNLTYIDSYGLYYMFSSCTNLATLSFPAVTSSSFVSTNCLNNMLYGVSNCTLHFPSNVQTTVENLTGYSTTAPFGATAGTVLFDLPATE